jgi:hypothetical protein
MNPPIPLPQSVRHLSWCRNAVLLDFKRLDKTRYIITSPWEQAVLIRKCARWTVRVPWKLLRSVAVKPGHAALTLMPADSRSEAKATVIALSAVFDEE